MINHVHLIATASDFSGFLCDFKKYTSRELKKNILRFEPNILKLFINKRKGFRFWHKTNMPILIESDDFFQQKLEYIHHNPVMKDYVTFPEYWFWSSASENNEIPVDRSRW